MISRTWINTSNNQPSNDRFFVFLHQFVAVIVDLLFLHEWLIDYYVATSRWPRRVFEGGAYSATVRRKQKIGFKNWGTFFSEKKEGRPPAAPEIGWMASRPSNKSTPSISCLTNQCSCSGRGSRVSRKVTEGFHSSYRSRVNSIMWCSSSSKKVAAELHRTTHRVKNSVVQLSYSIQLIQWNRYRWVIGEWLNSS